MPSCSFAFVLHRQAVEKFSLFDVGEKVYLPLGKNFSTTFLRDTLIFTNPVFTNQICNLSVSNLPVSKLPE